MVPQNNKPSPASLRNLAVPGWVLALHGGSATLLDTRAIQTMVLLGQPRDKKHHSARQASTDGKFSPPGREQRLEMTHRRHKRAGGHNPPTWPGKGLVATTQETRIKTSHLPPPLGQQAVPPQEEIRIPDVRVHDRQECQQDAPTAWLICGHVCTFWGQEGN